MRWNHLPVPGGIYQQHPRLLGDFQVIFAAKARRQEAEQRETAAKQQAKKPSRNRRR